MTTPLQLVQPLKIGFVEIIGDEHGIVKTGYSLRRYPARKDCKTVNKHQLPATMREALKQFEEFFAKKRTHFDLPLTAPGTPFQKKVWRALQNIPYGTVLTYGEVAKSVGSPKGARAVGMACNKNPLGVMVPCHRVVGASGKLTGFAGGVDAKSELLKLEGASW